MLPPQNTALLKKISFSQNAFLLKQSRLKKNKTDKAYTEGYLVNKTETNDQIEHKKSYLKGGNVNIKKQ